jgi:hypothetical protein
LINHIVVGKDLNFKEVAKDLDGFVKFQILKADKQIASMCNMK